MIHTCKKCGDTMFLDHDEQSLVCSNISCRKRDYRVICPLIEYVKNKKYFKEPADKMRLIVCSRCGIKSYTKVPDTTLCYNCRGYHHEKAKKRLERLQIQG